MGTSEFAVPCLLKILETTDLHVCAVVTTPDKPAGRSLRMSESPIKVAAKARNLAILQPESLSEPLFLKSMQDYAPDVAAVVAFRILPKEVFTIPKLGCVNIHASLLPELRGAAPIQWALMRGYDVTGVSSFLIERTVDTGGLLLQSSLPIDPDDDAGSLSEKLSHIGAELLSESLVKLSRGELGPKIQAGEPTRAPKITKEICQIDWSRSSADIRNQIRGLAPQPSAFTFLDGKLLKIFRSSVVPGAKGAPGKLVQSSEGLLVVATGQGGLSLDEIQVEGKRRMSSVEFLRGRSIPVGTSLG